MIHTASSFAWPSLTLTWLAERADTSLSAHAALRCAKENLESRGAVVSMTPEQGCLRFRSGWRAGRSWLGSVTGGTVTAERDADRILVTVRASLWPFALAGLFPAVMMVLRFPAFLIAVYAIIIVVTGLLTCTGLRAIARAALEL